MPLRKEPKETVTYPPSKRKAPPFKPQRPTKLRRLPSESQSSVLENQSPGTSLSRTSSSNGPRQGLPKPAPPAPTRIAAQASNPASRTSFTMIDDEDDNDDDGSNGQHDISSDDLPDDPLQSRPSRAPTRKPTKPTRAPRSASPPTRARARSSAASSNFDAADDDPPDSSDGPSIPQPLLLRLMHEHFDSKNTKIDKHAIVVFQKYIDTFIREAIARAALAKKEDVENGKASQSDADWLDRRDLETIVGGMVLDF